METAAQQQWQLKLVGFALEEISTIRIAIFAMKYAEMDSICINMNVMTEIWTTMTGVMTSAKLRMGGSVLEDLPLLLINAGDWFLHM